MPKRELDDVARMSDMELSSQIRFRIKGKTPSASFSDSIIAAHWLIEAMGRRGYRADMGTADPVKGSWCVQFFSPGTMGDTFWSKYSFSYDTRKLTFPRAVSEAALRALRARAAAKKEKRNG